MENRQRRGLRVGMIEGKQGGKKAFVFIVFPRLPFTPELTERAGTRRTSLSDKVRSMVELYFVSCATTGHRKKVKYETSFKFSYWNQVFLIRRFSSQVPWRSCGAFSCNISLIFSVETVYHEPFKH